ncbi:MAG TPA: hypothetical protein VFY97_01380 [Rhodanobacteraceae bacterium]|nr:hypothetical protein [Rhodanobacteraceae bacterium]
MPPTKYFASTLPTAVLVCALLAPSVALAQQNSHHPSHVPEASSSQATFKPDATLSREMAAIRAAFARRLDSIRVGELNDAEYATLGRDLEGRLGTIVRECKLPPDADAVLHGYIARMLTAAGTMQRTSEPVERRREAALAVVVAYDDYGTRFIDPAWQALDTGR